MPQVHRPHDWLQLPPPRNPQNSPQRDNDGTVSENLSTARFSPSGGTIPRYVLAVLLALAGTAMRAGPEAFFAVLDPAANKSFASYQALLAAVLLSALFCGRGPALLCLAL